MWRGLAGALLSGLFALVMTALLAALKTMRETPGAGFDFGGALWQVSRPVAIADWLQAAGIVAFGAIGGLFVAAVSAARHGAGRWIADEERAARSRTRR